MSTLSVIIPVYNTEKTLDRCVDSLVNQTYTKLQIILVNCGGADCAAICDSLTAKDNRIKTVCAQNNNVFSAYNAGIDTADGDYIVFAQPDSFFENTAIENCMAEIAAHSPDLLVCAMETSDENRRKVFIDGNLYTRYEYSENIARYISTGLGFSTVTNKVFAAHIINSRNLRFDETMPLVAEELFNCRYFTIANHIRCIAGLLFSSGSTTAMNGTTEYLTQCKEYSQKLIDAVQSKGLYNLASRAVSENYQKLLYRHLLLVASPDSSCSSTQRIAALEALSASADNVPLTAYLDTLPGLKNKAIAQFYRLRQWKMLLALLAK